MHLEGEVVGWLGVLVTLVAVLALVAMSVIDHLLFTVRACKVKHLSSLGVVRHENKGQINEEVAVKRCTTLHFFILLTMLFKLTDQHDSINSASVSTCERANNWLIAIGLSSLLPSFKLACTWVPQTDDNVRRVTTGVETFAVVI